MFMNTYFPIHVTMGSDVEVTFSRLKSIPTRVGVSV